MIKADYKDKRLVVDILSRSFDDNKSVNYVIKQDGKRKERLRKLMEYSFDICHLFGEVFLSDDKSACALIILPDKKKTSLKSILLDVKLIFKSLGLANIKKALDRESKIKRSHPNALMYHLWYIGVEPGHQNKGVGSDLLRDVLNESDKTNRPVYLETSTIKNITWYEKFGFRIYNELDLGYKLYLLKRE
jgi:hypothetical protein